VYEKRVADLVEEVSAFTWAYVCVFVCVCVYVCVRERERERERDAYADLAGKGTTCIGVCSVLE